MKLLHRTMLLPLLLVTAVVACVELKSRREVVSPDGSYVATWSTADGGAMTSTQTFVNIRTVGSLHSRYLGRVFAVHRGCEIGLQWRGTTLQIVCEYCGPDEASVRETRWRDVEIVYPRYGARYEPVVYSRVP
jgi:hypothetical protein